MVLVAGATRTFGGEVCPPLRESETTDVVNVEPGGAEPMRQTFVSHPPAVAEGDRAEMRKASRRLTTEATPVAEHARATQAAVGVSS